MVAPIRAFVGYYGVRVEDWITAHNHGQAGAEVNWIVENNMDILNDPS